MNNNIKDRELQPCPFCGEKPRIKISIYLDEYPSPHYDIECYECHMISTTEGYTDVANAIEAWNNRYIKDSPEV